MTLSLAPTTFLTGLVLLVFGILFFLNRPGWQRAVEAFPRSPLASYILMGTAGVWFLYKMLHLSPADFGSYSTLIFGLFAVVLVGSFAFVKDFLAVRGLAALWLLLSMEILRSAFGWYELPQRLFLVTFTYAIITLSLFLGHSPWLLRNFFEWLYRGAGRSRIFGGALAAYGLLLVVVTFTY
ncbi:MAG: hypothetical protein E1N59_2797 [Puniceicoccaceae bacterium 5H]|nr:MAG: hypothetical protein E1N59_2797 [Puniceicoccaceae bacterium 5H]